MNRIYQKLDIANLVKTHDNIQREMQCEAAEMKITVLL